MITRTSRRALALLIVNAIGAGVVAAQAAAAPTDSLARGRAIFASTCRSCHSVGPPSQGGPPMSRIARHYVQQRGSKSAAAAQIAEWLAGPTLDKSLLPREEVARFGVMPHQPLADAGRFAVAAYVVTLADSAITPRRGRRR